MYNPYYSPQDALIRVNGMDGARAYQMRPNCCAALFDGNDDVFYIKCTDGAGFPSIRAFRFEPVPEEKPQDLNLVTRQDFDNLASQIDEIKELIANAQQPVRKQSRTTVAE